MHVVLRLSSSLKLLHYTVGTCFNASARILREYSALSRTYMNLASPFAGSLGLGLFSNSCIANENSIVCWQGCYCMIENKGYLYFIYHSLDLLSFLKLKRT